MLQLKYKTLRHLIPLLLSSPNNRCYKTPEEKPQRSSISSNLSQWKVLAADWGKDHYNNLALQQTNFKEKGIDFTPKGASLMKKYEQRRRVVFM